MAALATVLDVEARLGSEVSAPARVGALLADASAVVRAYTRQTLSLVTGDTPTLRVERGRVTLPQRPAQAPTAISVVYPVAQVLLVGGWTFDGIDTVRIGRAVWAANGPDEERTAAGTVRVTYTHGYATIPDDVIAVVCQMVLRVIGSVATSPGLRSEQIDDYRYDLGGGLTSGTVGLVPEEKAILDRYRRRAASVALRA